jgi:hypothetical protein
MPWKSTIHPVNKLSLIKLFFKDPEQRKRKMALDPHTRRLLSIRDHSRPLPVQDPLPQNSQSFSFPVLYRKNKPLPTRVYGKKRTKFREVKDQQKTKKKIFSVKNEQRMGKNEQKKDLSF